MRERRTARNLMCKTKFVRAMSQRRRAPLGAHGTRLSDSGPIT